MRHFGAFAVLAALLLISVLFAASSGLSKVDDALRQTARDFLQILPTMSMLCVILGAVIYAAGKMIPNPEFSGRANGLAAAAIAASVVSLVIYLVLPAILQILYPQGDFGLEIGAFVP